MLLRIVVLPRSQVQDGFQTSIHVVGCAQKKEPKKLGRPVTFNGDPESAQLSEGERKRIKRRIANRESARRVRQKRQVLMEELHCRVGPCRVCEGCQLVYLPLLQPRALILSVGLLLQYKLVSVLEHLAESSPIQMVLHTLRGGDT